MGFITKSDISNGPQLGSQMIQYASMYSVQKQTGHEIVFFEECMNLFRGVKLFECFKLQDQIIPQFKFSYEEIDISNDLHALSINKNYDLVGTFHTYEKWHQYKSELLSLFNFRDEHKRIGDEYINNLGFDSKPLVSVHFRRTDYLLVASLNLSESYYYTALNYLRRIIGDFNILIFSDDINWCKNNIKGNNIYFSDGNNQYVDMYMMTQCNHNIIANSCFSWWGAYLNKNKNNITICPRDYVGKDTPEAPLINGKYYPREWVNVRL